MTSARTSTRRRRGYTILELLVVVATLLILGSVAVPSIFGLQGDTRSKAAADLIRSRMNDARAKAMEDGRPYRLALSSDFLHLRLAPDATGSAAAPQGNDDGTGDVVLEDNLPEGVTAQVLLSQDEQSTQDQAGWIRVATFLPDGTCKEDSIEVETVETGVTPFVIRLRGLTGAVSVARGGKQGANR